jgi:nitrate/TMAO reductase-like tetraheme cytochrome c subunit
MTTPQEPNQPDPTDPTDQKPEPTDQSLADQILAGQAAADPPVADQVPADQVPADQVPVVVPARRSGRVRAAFAPVTRVLARVPHPPLRSTRGLLVLFFLVAGFGAVIAVGGVMTIKYTETAGFCGRCHTMDPELKAHEMSAHKELTCAECHVEPGAAGWVKAKAKGSKQLFQIVTGKFPKPIPPPDHAELPSVQDTCIECHALEQITENGGPVKLILKPRYRLDESNTREMVAVMLRPGGLGEANGVRGVHWHIEQNVTYTASDERARKIDLVQITRPGGKVEQFIAGQQVGTSTDVGPDIARLKASEPTRRMDCIDCHNRVGHGVPTPARAVDEAIAAGKIDPELPFVKRDAVALLNRDYPSLAAADTAIGGLRATYTTRYPLVAKNRGGQIDQTIEQLKTVYRLIATPEMKVQAKTYPDNLGHQTSPGCFRCHDGAHYKVAKGRITNQKIPSTCATCHTFPQVGASVSDISAPALGARPADHKDQLYVFGHKNAVSKLDPAGTSCAACHQRSYCANCHNSGAVKVKHTAMLYNHATAITTAGGTGACAYCHQPVYCEGCHKDPVLESGTEPARPPPPPAAKNQPATKP